MVGKLESLIHRERTAAWLRDIHNQTSKSIHNAKVHITSPFKWWKNSSYLSMYDKQNTLIVKNIKMTIHCIWRCMHCSERWLGLPDRVTASNKNRNIIRVRENRSHSEVSLYSLFFVYTNVFPTYAQILS